MDDNFTVKDGWGGFFSVEAIFLCFIFVFDLHMYCDDMLINWNRLFFSLSVFVVVTGCFKMYRPMSPVGVWLWVWGVKLVYPTLALVSETLWSSGWLLTTERGSEQRGDHTGVLNIGWGCYEQPRLVFGTSCLLLNKTIERVYSHELAD